MTDKNSSAILPGKDYNPDEWEFASDGDAVATDAAYNPNDWEFAPEDTGVMTLPARQAEAPPEATAPPQPEPVTLDNVEAAVNEKLTSILNRRTANEDLAALREGATAPAASTAVAHDVLTERPTVPKEEAPILTEIPTGDPAGVVVEAGEITAPKPRGIAKELAYTVPAGIIGIGEMVARSMETVLTPIGFDDWAQAAADQAQEAYKKYQPTRKGFIEKSLRGGIESTMQSISAGMPSAGIGALIGGPVGAVIGFSLGAGGLFTAAEYSRFKANVRQSAEAEGASEEDIKKLLNGIKLEASVSAVSEGGFEALGDLFMFKVFGLLGGKVIAKPAKTGLKNVLFRFLKGYSKVAPVEIATEMATAATQVKMLKRAGVEGPDVLESMKGVIGPVLVQTALMTGGANIIANRTGRNTITPEDITEETLFGAPKVPKAKEVPVPPVVPKVPVEPVAEAPVAPVVPPTEAEIAPTPEVEEVTPPTAVEPVVPPTEAPIEEEPVTPKEKEVPPVTPQITEPPSAVPEEEKVPEIEPIEAEKSIEPVEEPVVKPPEEEMGKEIPFTKKLRTIIKGAEDLPRITDAKYLLTTKGRGNKLIAEAWLEAPPETLAENEILINLKPKAEVTPEKAVAPKEKEVPIGKKESWEMTRSEHRKSYKGKGFEERFIPTDKVIEEKVGSRKPQAILDYYKEKYPEFKGIQLAIDEEISDKSRQGSIYINKGLDFDTGEIDWNKVELRVAKNAPPETLRHEIEHAIDALNTTPEVRKSPEWRWQVNKFENYEHQSFPYDYLHRQLVKRALAEGKPVPAEVLKDYPELKTKKEPEAKPVAEVKPTIEEEPVAVKEPVEDVYMNMGIPLVMPDFVQKKISGIKKLFKEPVGINKKSWDIVKDYWGKQAGLKFKYSDKWNKTLRAKVPIEGKKTILGKQKFKNKFSPEELEDAIFYRQRTGNIWKGEKDTFDDVGNRLPTELKNFVDGEVDEHINNWRKMWNASPFTRDIEAREEVIKTYLTGVYSGNIKKGYDYLVGLKGRKFVTNNFMLNKKTYLNFEEAFRKAGLVPRFRNLADQLNYQDAYMIRLFANNELIGRINTLEKEINAKLIVRPNSKLYDEAKLAEDEDGNPYYVRFDDPYLRSYVAGKREDGSLIWATSKAPALVYRDLADAVQSIFNKDAYKPENIFWRNYDRIGSLLRYTRVTFSGFHFVPLAESFMGGKGLGVLNIPKWVEHGKKLLTDPVFMTETKEAGLRFKAPSEASRSQVEGSIQKIVNVLEAQGAEKKILGKGIKYITAPQFRLTRFLFDEYLPLLKAQMYYDYKQKGLALADKKGIKHTGTQMKELNREVASIVNDQFGGQAWEMIRVLNDPKVMKWVHRFVGYPDWCTDGKTRAMTKTGWKYYHELNIGDEIMTFDPETKTNSWNKLNDIYINENYDGDMVRIKNYNRSILITPEHTCYTIHDKSRKRLIVNAKNLNTHHLIPRVADFNTPTEEIYDDYFVKIVGWVITDGHIFRRNRKKVDGTLGNGFTCRITQSKPHTVEILKKLGLRCYVDKNNYNHGKFVARYPKCTFNVPANIVHKMKEIGIDENNKHLTWGFLSKLTNQQLRLLYKTMMLADGTGQNRFCGREREIFFMTLLQTMLGQASMFYQQEKNCWRTRIIESKNITCGSRKPTKEIYQGTIWCPSVNTGFWLAERKGLVFITGNSISALRQAGAIGEGGIRGELGRRYWLRYGIAFLAIQNALSYLFTGFYNDEDDEDKIKWSWDKAHGTFKNKDPSLKHKIDFQLPDVEIDLPLIGKFNPGRELKKDGTYGRRYYSHFGKQMLEIPRYALNFNEQMFAKSNPVIQLVFKQIFGGAPYKGGIFPARGGYTVAGEYESWKGKKGLERWRERAIQIVTDATPFSIQSMWTTSPATAGLLPISKATSLYASKGYIETAIRTDDVASLLNITQSLLDSGYKREQIKRTIILIFNNINKERLMKELEMDRVKSTEPEPPPPPQPRFERKRERIVLPERRPAPKLKRVLPER